MISEIKVLDSDFLKIGFIRKPHGLKGEMKVTPLTDNMKRFKILKKLFLYIDNDYILEDVDYFKISGQTVILKLSKYQQIQEIEHLRAVYLYVKRENAVPLSDGEYYTQDLIGCEIFHHHQKLGIIEQVVNYGSCDLFLVRYKSSEVYYPFINDYIDQIDIEQKKIEINEIEGFFD